MPDAVPATLLTAGDLVVIPLGDEHVMSSAPGLRGEPNLNTYSRVAYRRLPAPFVLNQGGGPERSHFVCGYFGCTRRPFNPLLDALPRMFHSSVSAFSREWMLSLVRAAAVESEDNAAGGDTMLAKIAELMFVEVVRKYIHGLPEDARGWFSALRDPQIGTGIRLMHDRPAEAWTVEALARAVGMSRSMFAERFVELMGSANVALAIVSGEGRSATRPSPLHNGKSEMSRPVRSTNSRLFTLLAISSWLRHNGRKLTRSKASTRRGGPVH